MDILDSFDQGRQCSSRKPEIVFSAINLCCIDDASNHSFYLFSPAGCSSSWISLPCLDDSHLLKSPLKISLPRIFFLEKGSEFSGRVSGFPGRVSVILGQLSSKLWEVEV